MTGFFVSLEGGEGAGKSTLLQGLSSHLGKMQVPCLVTRAPGGTDLGNQIRSLLLSDKSIRDRAELFLFLADRAQHGEEVILPALERGVLVLCDRFHDSTIAYQGVARGMDPQFIESLCLFATRGVKPDLTFYLDIDPVIGLQRARQSRPQDRIEAQALDFHQRIRDAFLHRAKEEPQRIQCLDGTLSADLVLQRALEVLYDRFLSKL